MNFDFLKDLQGLGYVYENCSNAEKLAATMPVQSVFTSRKSAELIAKFVYMAAHNQEMEGMSFADILSDMTVRRFFNSRDVMDAFHYIRKSGNKAVHGSDEESPEDAMTVLQDLHYVAGETACRLGLIDEYPAFEDEIGVFPEAEPKPAPMDDESINKMALEMFSAYVNEFHAQQDRENYVEMADYDCFGYTIEGNVEMHEYLAFKEKPKQKELTDYLQDYILTLVRLSVERSPQKAKENQLANPVTLKATLTVDNEIYNSDNLAAFCEAIDKKLPEANEFVIDLTCNGVLREFFNEIGEESEKDRLNMIRKDIPWTGAGMLDKLELYKRRDAFEYKLAVFYPDSGEIKCEKILNGKDIDLLSTCTDAVVDFVTDDEWWSLNLNLYIGFDFEKHSDALAQLQAIVRANVPREELRYCEAAWEDGDFDMLCNGIQWNCHCLREVQNFLDKINAVILPLKDEIDDIVCDGTWEIASRFAIAAWDWTEEGFKVKGTFY